jgi:hypothetical protein
VIPNPGDDKGRPNVLFNAITIGQICPMVMAFFIGTPLEQFDPILLYV